VKRGSSKISESSEEFHSRTISVKVQRGTSNGYASEWISVVRESISGHIINLIQPPKSILDFIQAKGVPALKPRQPSSMH
jgi:hypothetical protein